VRGFTHKRLITLRSDTHFGWGIGRALLSRSVTSDWFNLLLIAALFSASMPTATHAGRCGTERAETFLGACRNAGPRVNIIQKEATTAEWKTYSNSKLGIEFLYRGNHEVVVGCHYNDNCVAIVGQSKDPNNYLVAFEIFNGTLDVVAAGHAVFQKESDHWIAKGRSANHPVELISGSGWVGLKSVVDCGIADDTGIHPGAGECLWVIVSDGRRSIVADTQGTSPVDQDTMRSIESLRFRAR
jgi:hypothetical protein